MLESIVYTILVISAVYCLLGLIFAVFFVFAGIGKVDSCARDSSWLFRLFVFPGTVVFWPFLLLKLVRAKVQVPDVLKGEKSVDTPVAD